MTRPTDPALRDPAQETEYVRKLLLGLMTTLESKGLLTETEIGVIVRAAGQAVYAAPAPASRRAEAPADGVERSSTDPSSEAQSAPIPLLDITLD